MTTNRRRHTREYKLDALRLADRVGTAEAARQLGINQNTFYRWRSELGRDGEHAFPGNGRHVETDLERALRENARLKEELDILKKAALILERRRL